MDISDEMDKSWDHPWTTEEMKKNRREWSLAGDAGLLKYLQQFTENLIARTKKTEEALDALTTHLKETAILLDNVTNTSLALANTQFIESRVQEDDVEIVKKTEDSVQETRDQDSVTADLIATVSESVREGLNLMDEKYRRMEVVDSDSENEDDAIVLSVILGPNNPYQDRPLPYVIGSEKWLNSNKIGLESSSSESEQIDDEDESDTDKEETSSHGVFNANAPKIKIGRLSSSSSESDNYNERNNISYVNNAKADSISQSNMNSHSESITPVDSVPKAPLPSIPTPNFAEELAKRLGTVGQHQKPPTVDDKSEASINRFKDDLFTPEEDDALSNKSENVFSESKSLFGGQTSANLWKDKPPIKTYKNNIIPASIDVPPPISTVSTKPKSAIDDLFADAESDDSDDIFSSKNTIKKITKDNNSKNTTQSAPEKAQKKYLDIAAPSVTANIATSTPETDVKSTSLFSDEEDDSDLFGNTKSKPYKSEDIPSSNKKKPGGETSILKSILASDIENKVSSKLLRAQSSGSSGSDTPGNYETSAGNERTADSSRNAVLNDNIASRSPIVAARNNAENLAGTIESSYSSGISIHPPSINNTGGSSIGVDFQPQMTSTRLRSEEIYRERVGSDSLFAARTRNPVSEASSSANNQVREEQPEDGSSSRPDDVFENEDLFGPPPLPKANSRPAKSKSLFDDSDSGDELFSTTSSGSRSQKSTDFLVTTPQYPDKAKPVQRRGLFDEEIDIFASKDSPDVDIFGIAPRPAAKEPSVPSGAPKLPEAQSLFSAARPEANKDVSTEKIQGKKPAGKKISLFDDEDDVDDADLFGGKPARPEFKPETNLFKADDDDDDDDLFSSKKPVSKQRASEADRSSARKEERSIEPGSGGISDENSTRKTERKASDILSGNGLFSSAIGTHGLVFEDDDYDDLFASKGGKVKEDPKPDSGKLAEGVKESVKVERMPAEGREKTIDLATAAPELKITGSEGVTIGADIVPEDGNLSKTGTGKEEVVRGEGRISAEGEETENGTKKSPPKTLNFRTSVSPPPFEENNQVPRRAVSGKIKNLMGKMGDLKILSPMDTPPLWRRSEEKTDEEDNNADRDSDDGGCISTQGHGSPTSTSESSAPRQQSLQSTVSGGSNVETAISFDEPAQVETLSTAASKTRVRIQAKRRPQSRHARKSALRQSGIDFDTVDGSEGTSQEDSRGSEFSSTYSKEVTDTPQTNLVQPGASTSERVNSSTAENLPKTIEPGAFLVADDKSELGSLSKESSMSANKNTLLSPSTDEEDLFDVPPDLPEDPQKEDTLFGRAPILSPVDRVLSEKVHPANFKPLRETVIRNTDNVEAVIQTTIVPQSNRARVAQPEQDNSSMNDAAQTTLEEEQKGKETADSKKHENVADESGDEVIDPLRDSSHDPLKDPSQLFAFVTKTPSPEKGKNLLFAEDDSLFSSEPRLQREDRVPRKQILDLFADEAEGDLFSTSLTKPVKKPLKETKISLFDDEDHDDDDDDNLFGTVKKKPTPRVEAQKPSAVQSARKKTSLFEDDDNDVSLFSEHSEQSQKSGSIGASESSIKIESFGSASDTLKTSTIKDIFSNQSSGEEDIFAAKPVPKKAIATKSLFPSDDEDDDGQIFGGPGSAVDTKTKATENRPAPKKPVTRDLKKTAEKIGQDPLSILQDD